VSLLELDDDEAVPSDPDPLPVHVLVPGLDLDPPLRMEDEEEEAEAAEEENIVRLFSSLIPALKAASCCSAPPLLSQSTILPSLSLFLLAFARVDVLVSLTPPPPAFLPLLWTP
jgi:hypothetical protein